MTERKMVIKKKKGCSSEYNILFANGLEQIFINKLKVGEYRDELLGKDTYLVVPVTIIVEGVHNGFFYPADELKKSVADWENVLIPIYHPVDPQGQFLSAKEVETECVGRFCNSTWDENKKGIIGEFWILKEKISTEIIDELINGNMEVSTGLFADHDFDKAGTWNGEEYKAELTNYNPDHVALLPGSLGACSWTDGCGVRANYKVNKKEDQIIKKEVHNLRMFKNLIGKTGKILFFKNISDEEEKQYYEKYTELLGGMVTNEYSYEDIRYTLSTLVRDAFKTPTEEFPDVYIRDTFENHFIFERKGKLYKQEYMFDASDNITLGKEVTEMKLKSEYVPLTVTNEKKEKLEEKIEELETKIETNKKEEVSMKDELIGKLISNEACPFTEADKTFLETKDEAQLQTLVDKFEVKEVKVDEVILDTNKEVKPDEKKEVVTLESFLAKDDIPAEIKATLNESVSLYRKNKSSMIEKILANKKNVFTKEQLEAKETSELAAIVSLMGGEEVKEPEFDFSANLAGVIKAGEVKNEKQSDGSGVPVMAQPKWNADGTPDFSQFN